MPFTSNTPSETIPGFWVHVTPRWGYQISDYRQTLTEAEMVATETELNLMLEDEKDERFPDDVAGEEEYDRLEAHYAGMA